MKKQALANISGLSLLVFASAAQAVSNTGDGATTLSDGPLFVRQGVEPNLILTLDDSNSMRRALIDGSNLGLYKNMSPEFNELYFNPGTPSNPIIYMPPKHADGTPYQTSWNRAYVSGFKKDLNGDGNEDFVDLSVNFRPTGLFPLTSRDLQRTVAENDDRHQIIDPDGLQMLQWHPHGLLQPVNLGHADHPGHDDNELRKAGESAYYYQFKSTCDRSVAANAANINNTNCFEKKGIPASQQQNFANWYSFYRTRLLATQTVSNLAFSDLDENFRVGWQGMLSCYLEDPAPANAPEACQTNGRTIDNRVLPFTPQHKQNLIEWLEDIPVRDSTPTREAMYRAGEWYKNTTARGPYAVFDRTTGLAAAPAASGASSCRKNYHLLMTDGTFTSTNYNRRSNDSTTASLAAVDDYVAATATHNADNINQTLGDGLTEYTPRTPFKSVAPKSLASMAFYYWATDLTGSALDNNVAISEDAIREPWNARYNSATWQHMVNFTVGLGLNSLLNDGDYNGNTYGGLYDRIINSPGDVGVNWPSTGFDGSGNARTKVLDLWHAAVNSRGQFFSASNPQNLQAAFRTIFGNLSEEIPAAQVGFSGATLGTADFAFSSSFNSQNWSGEVKANKLFSNSQPPQLLTNSIPLVLNNGSEVTASGVLNAQSASDRNIKLARKTATGFSLIDFSWNSLNTAEKSLMNVNSSLLADNKGQQRLNWLRGDRNNTQINQLRTEQNRLGDITAAAPVYVGKPDSYGLSTLTPEGTSYESFMTRQANRSPRLYVASNDGMLHSFNVDANELNVNGGSILSSGDFFKEEFAYIPSDLLDKLPRLTDQEYNHQYYLDVTPTVQDVYASGSWKTILIGGMRGARSIYALDITDPDNISLLWEFNEKSNPLLNSELLGHTYAKPVVARLADGKWYALVSNGYDNQSDGLPSSGKAALFVIRIEDGELVKTLQTSPGSATNPNGLSEVALADINGDLITDYAYAGDLFGNLWRFDFNKPDSNNPFGTSSPSDWKVGLGQQPLYSSKSEVFNSLSNTQTTQPQPITSHPYVVKHREQPGHIVLFGTGKYIEPEDHLQATASRNSFYGIWDQQTKGTQSNSVNIQRNNLLQQTITNFSVNKTFESITEVVRTTTENEPDWRTASNTNGQLGWYLDFPAGNSSEGGEMVITEGAVRGDLLLFQTSQLAATPCENTLNSWLYGLDPVTGKKVTFPQFDVSGDDELDLQDQILSPQGRQSISALELKRLGAPSVIGDYIYFSTTSGVTKRRYQSGSRRNARQVWRKLK
ncbi:pilus assembly protein [Pelagibaculum spongiae]|uniref:PilY1 beta-propeller domain-containing protein n=1 Tax=Pelagibaculum spongiae TaxID=2080658 RepID=A0A2V1GZR8_9GAMM|nr:PilC/PilY family type IV pilus protein [Pelagibaculum spongiae]PVZ71693.1 hypothetical protein DC094_01300 [Pelagibaculum spongiae]